ncbi:putative ribosomal protein subunit l37 [Erysiphe neolycopersici]|uniref:Large ribosomal subunit protein mL54 n=1 Tax=Erysiphe neolycopersici TaxID=212602 RepID=A0A420HZ10_9PEZI|nr:putative ribosomal protein subunit l37 [Erysiphe neolycopersici]
MTYTYHFLKRPLVNPSYLVKFKYRNTLNIRPCPAISVFSTTASSLKPSNGTTTDKPSQLTGAEPYEVNLPESISPAGTVLRGLNYVKGRDDPISLKEEEYPSWLWGLLDKKNADISSSNEESDLFSKSKKLRRKAAKKQRKLEALKETSGNFQEVKVSLTQQSIDLPSNEEGTLAGATNAEEARKELRVAMRNERKKKIKENNYLRSV